MKKQILLIILSCLALSCDRYPDPSIDKLLEYSFSYQVGQGKRLFTGEWVSGSIPFYVVHLNAPEADSTKVLFEVLKGGGEVTVQSDYTNKNGYVYTGWKLGSESFDQILRAKTYDLSGNFLSYSDLVAYGFGTDRWDASSVAPDGTMMGMATDTVNKITLMVNNNTLYRQGTKYFLWEPVINPALVSPRTVNIDNNGVFYVSTWKGELVKSVDHGESWQTCTKPFPDRPYYFYISASNDNWVWAYYFDYPTKFSKNGGLTWTDAGSGLSSKGFGDVFRLKDGSLLFHGSNCCSLCRSFDNGLTWTPIVTPGHSVKLYVNDKDELFILTQQNGVTFYKSTDYGVTFTSVYDVWPQWSTSFENTFNKWGNFYYILIPGYGILKSSDLTHYDDYWVNSDLRTLFIDYNGVLIAKDWNMKTVYYRKNSE